MVVLGSDVQGEMAARACVHEAFEARARARPEEVALAHDGAVIRYGELDARASSLAAALQARGVGPEDVVAVHLPRSIDFVIAILGVLKAGGAYLPIDYTAPDERVAFMLADSRARAVVTDRASGLAGRADALVLAEVGSSSGAPVPPGPRPRRASGEDLAYVIYTSGSTGRPKAAGIAHRTLAALASWERAFFELGAEDACAHFSNVAFDAHVWEIWPALISGARVDIVPDHVRADGDALASWLATSGVSWAWVPTALADALLRRAWEACRLRWLTIAGEALRTVLPAGLPFQVANAYGPTECTCVVTLGVVEAGDPEPPIGRPIAGVRAYVLDEDGAPVAAGAPGELCIGGDLVGRGYLGRPALTGERFVPDPFADEPGARMYRTGDLVEERDDRTLRFCGRIDGQVKIRGFRVELGEIEAALARHPSVREAAVTAPEQGARGRRLVAYVTARGGGDEQALFDGLREHLGATLPAYMVPSAFVLLDALPLTPSGKVDRRALPAPDAGESAAAYVAPRDATEATLCELWRDVLGVERVGALDDFFDLGGHSLSAGSVASRLRARFGLQLPVRAIFEARTPRALAATLGALGDGDAPAQVAPVDRSRPHALSSQEERLWFLHERDPLAPTYNECAAIRVRGALDEGALGRALARLEARHDVLRSRYVAGGRGPARIVDGARAEVPVSRLASPDASGAEAALRAMAREPYDLSTGPLWRPAVVSLGEGDHVLAIGIHHVVTDEWSIRLLLRDLEELYRSERDRTPARLPERGFDFTDWAAHVRAAEGSDPSAPSVAYFARALAGVEPVELPADRPRPAVQTFDGAKHRLRLSTAVRDALQTCARREGTTLAAALLAVFAVFVHRHSRCARFAIAMPVARRSRQELEDILGFFVNTVAVGFDFSDRPSFRALLRRTRDATLEAQAHGEASFARVVDAVVRERDPSRAPLCQLSFAPQPAGADVTSFAGAPAERLDVDLGVAKFDLSLFASERRGGLDLELEYATALFDRATVERFAARLVVLLEGALDRPDERVHALPMMTDEERRQVLVDWNTAPERAPAVTTVASLFEDAARRDAGALALVAGTTSLTYGQLDARANQLARLLRARGVRRGDRVLTWLFRSADLVIANLAVMKAGGAFVPVDPAYPAERTAFMIDDAAPRLVLTHAELAAEIGRGDVVAVDTDEVRARVARESTEALEDTCRPADAAYVIYTSGSTGRPKGVVVPHAQLARLVAWHRRAFDVSAKDRATQLAGPAFDASVWEIWPYLASGASLHIADDDVRLSPAHLRDWLVEQQVSIAFVPTAIAEDLVELAWPAATRLRFLLTGGDQLHKRPRERQPFTLVNNYGPTECTVVATSGHVSPGRHPQLPDIGRRIDGTRLYVLDRRGEPTPIGVAGELCIGGELVSQGYLNRPVLTAEKFVPDPFAATPGARMYRTGDLVRHVGAGRLEFFGRTDRQVKLRGFRIELGEIESALTRSTGVTSAAVDVRSDAAGQKRLVAYVGGASSLDVDALRAALERRLPEYMVPSAFVVLDALPLTPNGKVDRRALPAPDFAASSSDYVAPRDETEEILAGVWREVLGLPRVGVHDDFFALGGHSLLATRVVARVQDRLRVPLPVRAIFEAPTVARLAARLERRPATGARAPIERARREAPLEPSFAQERLWFLDQLDPGSPAYHVPLTLRLRGELDVAALRGTVAALVQRHEVFRTTFDEADGRPRPRVHEALEVSVDLHAVEALDEARAQARAILERPFDLARGPLLRAALFRVGPDDHLFVLVMHHVVTDGASMEVLAREARVLYAALRAGRPAALPDLRIAYADFAAWQRGWLGGRVLQDQIDYWTRHLRGAPPVLELPTDRPRRDVKRNRGATVSVDLRSDLAERVSDFARREGATPFMILLAAFGVLVARHSGQHDVVIGTPIANRTRPELEGLVGFFVNTLALRLDLRGEPSFRDVVRRAKEVALGAFDHQDVPFERLVEELRPPRDARHTPVFQVMFSHLVREGDAWSFDGLRVEEDGELEVSKFDLSLAVEQRERLLRCSLEYDSDLFDHATALRFAERYAVLLGAAIDGPDGRVATLPLLSDDERRRLLAGAASIAVAVDESPVHEQVARRAREAPDACALAGAGTTLSYGEMNRRANRLARALRRRGVGPEDRVPILLSRGPDMVVAALAALKCGAAYAPLDPTHPGARVASMLADLGARVLVSRSDLTTGLAAAPADPERLHLDDPALLGELSGEPDEDLDVPCPPRRAAYVIYTSGTTGRPKGAVVEHGGLANLVGQHVRAATISSADRLTQIAGPAFDATTNEIWPALCAGASLHFVSDDLRRSPAELVAWIRDRGVTVAYMPTVLGEAALDEDWTGTPLRVLCLGGQALRRRPRTDHSFRLLDLYGPTETTNYVTREEVTPDEQRAPSVGRPIAGARVYVLDREGNPCPFGVLGEVCVGGLPVGRGYLGRPASTAEAFVPDPLAPAPGSRMYRTGDRGRWLADGRLQIVGRDDDQIKIRGFRVELGEVEVALRAAAELKDAVVVAREDLPGDARLVAYVVPRGGAVVDAGALRTGLRASLPDYMVPSAFVALDALPLTPNGKVDRRALPAPEVAAPSEEYVAPRDASEEALCEIWREVLGLERVGVHDDFFALGGHSLLATRVVSRVRSVLGVELPVRALFDAPRVAGLAAHLREGAAAAVTSKPLSRVDRSGPLPASFAQTRLWFLDRFEPDAATYNVPVVLRVEGELVADELERAVRALVSRHEALRTTFIEVDGEPRQVVHASADVRLKQLQAASEDDARELVAREVSTPFDLSAGPVVRASLVRLSADTHLFVLCIHHIATDGWSMGVLLRELSDAYAAAHAGATPLGPRALDYADFAVWQREWLRGDVLGRQLAFWREHLDGAPPSLDLPTDRPRPARKQHRGGRVALGVSPSLGRSVGAFARREGATPFMVLLAAYATVLARWSRQDDVVVGVPIANRAHAELEAMVGFFVNTLPMRTRLHGAPTFRQVVQRVRQAALSAYSHQDLPFEKLVDELGIARDPSRTPIFQAAFVLQNAPDDRARGLLALDVREEPAPLDVAKFDLSLSWTEGAGGFEGSLEYDVALFDEATVERFASHLLVLLEAALERPDERAHALPMMTEEERRRVLVDWNATARPPGRARSLHALFEASVERAPDAVAVEDERARLTYAELDDAAERVAGWLALRGVERGSRVAIEVSRSAQMVAALLGVLKAGAAYVPIDPRYPDDRRAFMREDAGCAAALTNASLSEAMASTAPRRARAEVGPEDLAYVLYTSGSTGRPKGVMVPHRAVVNVISSVVREPGIEAGAVMLALTTLSFDVAGAEIFGPLAAGARVVVATEDAARDPTLLAAMIEQRGVTVAGATPATWSMLTAEGWRPPPHMSIHTAGEALGRDLADRLTERGAALANLYGPTETAIYSTGTRVARGEAITIGRPVDNTAVYVLDDDGAPAPIGVAGQLYIAGAGVSHGYNGRPSFSAEKFVPDPFSATPGARMFATGDVARWLASGSLEYLGRADHQVKVRGFRIELGEVEAALRSGDGVREAVVTAREDGPGGKRLVSYLTPVDGRALDVERVKAEARRSLPDYMLPSAFVILDALPRTPSGKLDRNALPAPDFTASLDEYVGPRDATEEALCEIFCAVLELERVGVHDDFFSLGGHSLLATRVVARVHARLGASVPVRALFEAPTVSGLAVHVERARGASKRVVERAAQRRRFPLSYNQMLWWRRQQHDPRSARYTVVEPTRLRGDLDVEVFSKSLDEVFRRHGALRTRFERPSGGEPVQVVGEPHAGVIERRHVETMDDVEAFIAGEHERSFGELDGVALVRAVLLTLADDDHVLVFTIHRAAVDPHSAHEIVAEAFAIYRALAHGEPHPSAPPYEYVDFVAWQRDRLSTDEMRARIASARRRLEGAAPLALPFDRPEPDARTTKTHWAPVAIDEDVVRSIDRLAAAEATTSFVVQSALLKAFLSSLTGQSDVTVVAPSRLARGLNAAFAGVIGCFSDYLVMRTDISPDLSLRALVRREHETVLQAQRDADLPCMLLTDEYVDGPLWRVVLNAVPDAGDEPAPELPVTLEGVARPLHRMVDLAWVVSGSHAILVADADKFERATAEHLARGLGSYIGRALTRSDEPLSRIRRTLVS